MSKVTFVSAGAEGGGIESPDHTVSALKTEVRKVHLILRRLGGLIFCLQK